MCLSGYLQQYSSITETSEVREGTMVKAQGRRKAGLTVPAAHAKTLYLLHEADRSGQQDTFVVFKSLSSDANGLCRDSSPRLCGR